MSPVFLTADLLLVPNISEHAFQIYHIPPSVSSPIRPILSLGLPPLADSMMVESIDSQGSPSPTQTPKFGKYLPSHLPFLSDPALAIIVFSLAIGENNPGIVTFPEDFWMVVHRQALLDLVPLGVVRDPNSQAVVMPWDSWGPPVTRWFCDDDFTAGSSIHPWGQRFVQHVFPYEVTNEGDSDTITMYDFNPCRVREVQLSKEHILVAREGHLDDFKIDVFSGDVPGSICRKNIFRFDIIGKLPYIRYRSSNWPEYETVFIDEERMICVQASPFTSFSTFWAD